LQLGDPVRLFIFESVANANLQAFAGDVVGRKLPDQISPWRQIGAVRPENVPPCNLSRDTIAKAINVHGFQLWRLKSKGGKNLNRARRVSAASHKTGIVSSEQFSSRAIGLCTPHQAIRAIQMRRRSS
jgi:hypothetical protein